MDKRTHSDIPFGVNYIVLAIFYLETIEVKRKKTVAGWITALNLSIFFFRSPPNGNQGSMFLRGCRVSCIVTGVPSR